MAVKIVPPPKVAEIIILCNETDGSPIRSRIGLLGKCLGSGLTTRFDHLKKLFGCDGFVGRQVVQPYLGHLLQHEFDAIEQDVSTALGQVADVFHRRTTLVNNYADHHQQQPSDRFRSVDVSRTRRSQHSQECMTHAGNVSASGWLRKTTRTEKSVVRLKENPVLLAWLVRRSTAAGKTQHCLQTQLAAILRSAWRPTQIFVPRDLDL